MNYFQVYQQELHSIYKQIRSLQFALGSLVEEEFWIKFLWRIKRYCFDVASTPLSFSHLSNLFFENQHKTMRYCRTIYPHFVADVEAIYNTLFSIFMIKENPIFITIQSLLQNDNHTAILIKEPRLVNYVNDFFVSQNNSAHIEVMPPAKLKGTIFYEKIICIGPTRWFPRYIFSAARSRKIDVIQYAWMTDVFKSQPLLVGTISPSRIEDNDEDHFTSDPRYINISNSVQTITPSESNMDPPDEDMVHLLTKKTPLNASVKSYDDTVDAQLFILADRTAVFLEASDTTKVLVLDVGSSYEDSYTSEQTLITRVPVKLLRTGIFVLLRTGESGDYIITIADQILGVRASHLRYLQEDWKDKLRRHVQRSDLFQVSIALLDHGSLLAQESNVRNWMSSRTIRPQKDSDFKAIMRLIGYESQFDKYQNAANEIRNAHRQAGKMIRQMLLNQVHSIDYHQLHTHGRFDFVLPDVPDMTLSAFRINQCISTISRVTATRIGQVFNLEHELWRE
ncbi:hypothetical protein [Herpetosiphon giganteus]|uniref:DISARM anti-phage system protein DrmE domain-containing protein n=1 Tax=Herpetosiphon giganteus TaxID=2029754 RepID=UPI00195626C3|nr:hypothetical protein [Herpetosiphon giganteus]MBM7841616.1 hypothetical protein [Herpetosiphon giganteus]